MVLSVISIGLYFSLVHLGIFEIHRSLNPIALTFLVAGSSLAYVIYALSSVDTAQLDFTFLNIERLISPVLFLFSVIFVWYIGGGLEVVLVAFLVTKLPALGMKLWRVRGHLIGPIDMEFTRDALALAPRLLVSTGMITIASQMDRIVATATWTTEQLGYYFVAFSVAGAGLTFALQAMRLTLLPNLAGLKPDERRRKVETLFRLSLIVGLGVVGPIWILAPWLVPLVYGAAYAPAADFVRGLAVAMALLPTMTVVTDANRAAGRAWPGIEMALGAMAAWGLAWTLTGLTSPTALFTTMAVANGVSMVVGMRHLARDGAVCLGRALVPGAADLRLLRDAGGRYLRRILRRST
jgi:O-antigen/teichoic acid export membrane protein